MSKVYVYVAADNQIAYKAITTGTHGQLASAPTVVVKDADDATVSLTTGTPAFSSTAGAYFLDVDKADIAATEAGKRYTANWKWTSSGTEIEDITEWLLLPATRKKYPVAGNYLSITDAEIRLLERFDIELMSSGLNLGDLILATQALDNNIPFKGAKFDSETNVQPLQFPRSWTLDGDGEGVVPNDVLDYVALSAYISKLEPDPGIKSESVADGSITYSTPKINKWVGVLPTLIQPYLRTRGTL